MDIALSVLALVVALVALGLQLQQRRSAGSGDPGDVDDLPQDALGLRHEVAALRSEAAVAFQHLAVVRYVATQVAVMYRGRLVEQGPAAQILTEPEHEYTRELLAAVPGNRRSAQ